MIKPASLRAALVAAIPELARDPDKLAVFVESGKIVSRATPPLAFEYRYTLTLIMLDMAIHSDAVMLPLLIWVARNQPELLVNHERGNEAIKFDAEFLGPDALDLSISLDLTECVTAVPKAGGGYDLTHWEEPDYDAFLNGGLDGAPTPAPPLVSVYVNGQAQALIPNFEV